MGWARKAINIPKNLFAVRAQSWAFTHLRRGNQFLHIFWMLCARCCLFFYFFACTRSRESTEAHVSQAHIQHEARKISSASALKVRCRQREAQQRAQRWKSHNGILWLTTTTNVEEIWLHTIDEAKWEKRTAVMAAGFGDSFGWKHQEER